MVTFRAHSIEEHLVRAKRVPQVFRIRVWQPIRRADTTERFPVVYATDADEFFDGYATLAQHLQLHGEAKRFILVGIGYEDAHLAPILRVRDLYPAAVRALYASETRQVAESPLLGGVDDVDAITRAADANDFLQFICDELMPLIDGRYPVSPGDNHYLGYSAGGTFGLHALFTRPDVFRTYILGSPATSYNGTSYGVPMARAYQQARLKMNAKVFISVGELEEFKRGFERFDLTSGYYILTKFLKHAAIPGLDLTTRVFPTETHATAWSLAFTHGARALLGPADHVPFWPEYHSPTNG